MLRQLRQLEVQARRWRSLRLRRSRCSRRCSEARRLRPRARATARRSAPRSRGGGAGAGGTTPLSAIVFGTDLAGANAQPRLGAHRRARRSGRSAASRSRSRPGASDARGPGRRRLRDARPGRRDDGRPDRGRRSPAPRSPPTTRPSTAPSRSGRRATTAQASASPSSTAASRTGRDFTNHDRVAQEKLRGQVDRDDALNDPYGHGTFVAGIVGGYGVDGRYVGIAPEAAIEAVNVSRPDGVRSSDVMAALLWVLANKDGKHIKVVNLSLTETVAELVPRQPAERGRRAALARRRRRRRLRREQGPRRDLLRARQRPVRDHRRRDRHERHDRRPPTTPSPRSPRSARRATATPSPS